MRQPCRQHRIEREFQVVCTLAGMVATILSNCATLRIIRDSLDDSTFIFIVGDGRVMDGLRQPCRGRATLVSACIRHGCRSLFSRCFFIWSHKLACIFKNVRWQMWEGGWDGLRQPCRSCMCTDRLYRVPVVKCYGSSRRHGCRHLFNFIESLY